DVCSSDLKCKPGCLTSGATGRFRVERWRRGPKTSMHSRIMPAPWRNKPTATSTILHKTYMTPCMRLNIGASLRTVLRPKRRNSKIGKHTSELQSRGHLVCRLLLEKKKKKKLRNERYINTRRG